MALPVEPNAETEGSGVLEDVFGNREVFDREAKRVDKDDLVRVGSSAFAFGE